jgi:hypothetical protein
VLRVKHYVIRTEEVYIHWIKRYNFFHQKLILAKWAWRKFRHSSRISR